MPLASSSSLDTAARRGLAALAVGLGLVIPAAAPAAGMSAEARRDFLEAIRPEAARQAGQAVRFRVDHLNTAGDWALLVGSLLPAPGRTLEWELATSCDPTLDKMLWVVARKSAGGWRVRQMYICSPEPPYWNLDPAIDYARPCALYTGLVISGEETAEQACLAYRASRRHRP